MMYRAYGTVFLIVAALIVMGTAIAHLSCIVLGPQCYSLQMAPPSIIDSAQQGTLLAPLGTVLVSSVFVAFGLYALSAARIIRKLPLLNLAIYAISILFVIRGLLPTQLWLRHPERVSDAIVYVGCAWLATGLMYFLGYRNVQRSSV